MSRDREDVLEAELDAAAAGLAPNKRGLAGVPG
jgi:hypothetical protein